MDAIEALKTRRCIRVYTNQSVPREVVEDIVDCGRLAATARNGQPWEFVVITDPKRRRSIAQKTDFGRFIANAPVCVVVLCQDSKYYLEDGCCASHNISWPPAPTDSAHAGWLVTRGRTPTRFAGRSERRIVTNWSA